MDQWTVFSGLSRPTEREVPGNRSLIRIFVFRIEDEEGLWGEMRIKAADEAKAREELSQALEREIAYGSLKENYSLTFI